MRDRAVSDKFYILCIHKELPRSDLALWWKPDCRGYTTDLDQAGVYTAEEVEVLQRTTLRLLKEGVSCMDVPIPVARVRAVACLSVLFDCVPPEFRPVTS